MGNTQLPFQRHSFINPSQQHVAELERPDPIVDLFEADAMLAERRREVQPLGLETNGTRHWSRASRGYSRGGRVPV
jgi:hypothetical protein